MSRRAKRTCSLDRVTRFAVRLSDADAGQCILRADLVARLEARGLRLGAHDCYAWIHPPFLGGADDASNVEVADLAVTLSLCGQLHSQLRGQPVNAKISGFDIK
jgi:hypothetical protein